ncbi:L,D-transpeptidase family protein [Xinfangfangia sp. D13-10-4-6]|uniref:L,D-transpeptidase family protein n=1 Tax=Pseudogemmobacter hezensis TaxID=2737662 RepID=UPI001556A2BB|nr:L,D-transpeptidase family protein [Pseudogemmobacter hezensis]NPD14543.1 L,D-transpeptidase family protein [Pseudogemmobacter hezensis]
MRQAARIFSALSLCGLVIALILLWRVPEPDGAPGQSGMAPPLTGPIERIVIEKAARRMTLIQGGVEVRRYDIALGFAPEGDKEREGDGRTPEGEFRIDRRNDRSAYHLSLGLDYPQPADRARAAAGGYSPGGDIMIHGQPNAVPDAMKLRGDWTAGCIALTNAQMREVWQVADIGTIVEVRP